MWWDGGCAVCTVNLNDWRTDAAEPVRGTSVPGAGEAGQSETSSAGTEERPGRERPLRWVGPVGNRPSRSRDWLAAPSGSAQVLRHRGRARRRPPSRPRIRQQERCSDGPRSGAAAGRLPESADRQRSGGSGHRRASARRAGAGRSSSRRQRDRRPADGPADFGPAVTERRRVEVAHDWRGARQPAGPGVSAPGNHRRLTAPLPDGAAAAPERRAGFGPVGEQEAVAEDGAVDTAARASPEPALRRRGAAGPKSRVAPGNTRQEIGGEQALCLGANDGAAGGAGQVGGRRTGGRRGRPTNQTWKTEHASAGCEDQGRGAGRPGAQSPGTGRRTDFGLDGGRGAADGTVGLTHLWSTGEGTALRRGHGARRKQAGRRRERRSRSLSQALRRPGRAGADQRGRGTGEQTGSSSQEALRRSRAAVVGRFVA